MRTKTLTQHCNTAKQQSYFSLEIFDIFYIRRVKETHYFDVEILILHLSHDISMALAYDHAYSGKQNCPGEIRLLGTARNQSLQTAHAESG